MLLPKSKSDVAARHCLRRSSDVSGRGIWPAKVYTNISSQGPVKSPHLGPVDNTILHANEKSFEVWSSEICPCPQVRQGIYLRSNAIKLNIRNSLPIQALGKVSVDPQKLGG